MADCYYYVFIGSWSFLRFIAEYKMFTFRMIYVASLVYSVYYYVKCQHGYDMHL